MTHFGLLSPPSPGHLNPMTALGTELKRRGHRVTLFGVPDVEPWAEASELNFRAVNVEQFPPGSLVQVREPLGKLSGIAALFYTFDQFRQGANLVLQDIPPACRKAKVEALLIDQTVFEGATVAEVLGLPFVTISSALLLNPEPTVPPALTSWNYDPSVWGQIRNQFGTTLLALMGIPIKLVIDDYRRKWSLPPSSIDPLEFWSKLAIISQQPPRFEFPRREIPSYVHFTGSLLKPEAREKIPFPWEKLTGKPLIYASLGTVQNRLKWVFLKIADVCASLDVQLVLSLGGAMEPEELGYLLGSPLVVKSAPQLEILERATLCITHAGLNTTLECLSQGVPMVAIPIANDQPGVASRIAWTGTGVVVPLNECCITRLRTAVKEVLINQSYRQQALRLKQEIEQQGGVSKAANIIETVISQSK